MRVYTFPNRGGFSRILAVLFVLAVPYLQIEVLGQATTGSISGLVADGSGAAVPDVNIEVENRATGVRSSSKANAGGQYSVINLPPGIYSVTAEKDGFKKIEKHGFNLDIDQKLRVDLRLVIGDVLTKIDVAADAVAVQTQSAETGQVIEARRISELPLLGRDFLDLTLLIPGVVEGTGGNNANYSVNGQREFSNSILVNGVEVTSNRNNDTQLRPGLDSVEEFKALTSTYAPELGRASGGIIAVQTKSGTNQVHGSLFEFIRTNATTARTFFAPIPSALKQNNFGGTIGGPIRKNKTFFFAGYEGVRTRDTPSSLISTVPFNQLNVLPSGAVDLSGLRDPNAGTQIPIYDPQYYTASGGTASQQFANNIIPADRISPAGLNILQALFPHPNLPGAKFGWANNFASSQRVSENRDTGDLRIDHTFSEKDRITGTYDIVDFRGLTSDPYQSAIAIAGGGSADAANVESSRNHALGIAETHAFNAKLLNEFRFTLLRTSYNQNDLIHGTNLADKLGVGNINIPGFPATSGFPQIALAFGPVTGGSTYKPLSFADQDFLYADNFSWIAGSHSMKFGYEYRSISINPNFTLFPTGYQYYYGAGASLTSDPTYAAQPVNPALAYPNGGNEIADLLLGLPGFEQQGLQFHTHHSTSFEEEAYLQDTWQATSRLVVTYGLRYEFKNPYTEDNNYQSNFDPATNTIILAGRGGNSRTLVEPYYHAFAPRFGLAYRVDPKTSVRAGYGIFYTPEDSARSEQLTFNYPFSFQQQFFNSPGAPPQYQLDQGVPRPTSIPVGPATSRIDAMSIPFSSVQSYYYINPNFRTGYSQQFNFTIQRQFGQQWLAEIGYVGALGRRLPLGIGNLNTNNQLSSSIGPVNGMGPDGFNDYHSLQAKLDKDFANGFSILAAYTWAKNIDNGEAPLAQGGNQGAQDFNNRALEKGPALNDLRHNFTFSELWELPFGTGKQFLGNGGHLTQAVIGGWQLNNILVMHTGLPFNVIRGGGGCQTSPRPDLVGNPNSGEKTLTEYFNTAAFSEYRGGVFQPQCAVGTAGRDILRGPGFINLDSSLFKDFAIAERYVFQLRVEAFNIANMHHFDVPNSNIDSAQFGSITGTIANPRIMQFALRLKF